MKVLGHSFVRLLIRSHRSLICLIHTACFAHALHCAHLFACSLISFIPKLLGKWMIRWLFFLSFFLFWPIVNWKSLCESQSENGSAWIGHQQHPSPLPFPKLARLLAWLLTLSRVFMEIALQGEKRKSGRKDRRKERERKMTQNLKSHD